jgi:hypothetical protein
MNSTVGWSVTSAKKRLQCLSVFETLACALTLQRKHGVRSVANEDGPTPYLLSRREMYTFLYPLDACRLDPPTILPGIVF